jgi:hypothetical protein
VPRSIASVVALMMVAAPLVADAQSAPSEPARERAGLILEGELGVAAIGAGSEGEKVDGSAIEIAGRFGGYLTPRTSLLLVAGVTSGGIDDPDTGAPGGIAELYLGAGFRFWITERLWAQLDLATACLIVERPGFVEQSFDGARFQLTGAYVVFEGQRLDLDARIGLAGGNYGDDVGSGSVLLGLGLSTQ